MSDVTTPAATPPVSEATPAVQAPVTPAPDLPPVGQDGWLKARIERATEDGAKRARKELKAEKKAAQAAAQEARNAAAMSASEVQAAMRAADAILAEVPEAERKAITDAAGSSAAKKLELFAAWKVAKLSVSPPKAPETPVAPAATPAPVAAPAATIAAPATSAPPPAAPTPGAAATEATPAEIWEELRGQNPYLAAQYLLNNQLDILPILNKSPNDISRAARKRG